MIDLNNFEHRHHEALVSMFQDLHEHLEAAGVSQPNRVKARDILHRAMRWCYIQGSIDTLKDRLEELDREGL